MSKNSIELNYDSTKKLEEKIRALPNKAEYEINNYLWHKTSDLLSKEIYNRMPISSEDKTKYERKEIVPKTHAKNDESLDEIRYNLGIKIQTKVKPRSKDFGYLIFPNEGRGIRQRRKGAQEFFEKTLENNTDRIENGLISHLESKIEEEINNV